jgi:hypothetical protein
VILGGDTVTVIRNSEGSRRNTSGDLVGTDTETDVTGCSVQPTSGSELTDSGELVVTNLTAYLPPGTDVLATDRVRWLGAVYAVNGPPALWHDQTGTPSHVQVQLLLRKGQG